jgi:hypothetical protein
VDAFHWQTVAGGVSLTMRPIGGLIGETWLSPDIQAKNQAAVAVTIEGATLTCGHASYPADSVRLFSRADSCWVQDTKGFLAPGETRKLDLQWSFQQPIGDVLRAPVSILLKLKVGDDAQVVAIPMSRE